MAAGARQTARGRERGCILVGKEETTAKDSCGHKTQLDARARASGWQLQSEDSKLTLGGVGSFSVASQIKAKRKETCKAERAPWRTDWQR